MTIARKKGEEFLRFPGVQFLPVTPSIISKSQLPIEQFPLKPRDVIHAASAMVHSADSFITFDHDLDGIPGVACQAP